MCWVWGIALGLWAIAVFAPSSPSKSQQEPAISNRMPSGGVHITNFAWNKASYDIVMLADFTIKNDRDHAVKDITIHCVHSGPSGTRIDSNTRTLYAHIPAHGSLSQHKFNMGFFHNQTAETSCKVTNYQAA
jgi:hypothetical protein